MPSRAETRANGHKLTQTEEDSLINWILDIDARGYPPKIYAVGDAAKLLLSERVGAHAAHIGKNWPYNFVNRQPAVKA